MKTDYDKMLKDFVEMYTNQVPLDEIVYRDLVILQEFVGFLKNDGKELGD